MSAIGLCECGCGQRTTRLKHDDKARGLKAGDYSRFVHGHWHVALRRLIPSWGRQSQRKHQLEELRRDALKGVDVSPYFSTEAGLNNFLNFTHGAAPLLNLFHFPKPAQPLRETYETFIARREQNAREREARKSLRLLFAAHNKLRKLLKQTK